MKSILDLTQGLNDRKDFHVARMDFDGGYGVFTKGSLKDATVIWSYAGGGEHVSICPKNRTPNWDEMCMLKDIFWSEDETVIQYHPAKSNYVNNLRNCLHLWKPIKQYAGELPVPPDIMVGIKALGNLG